jgi:hypothetical protein
VGRAEGSWRRRRILPLAALFLAAGLLGAASVRGSNAVDLLGRVAVDRGTRLEVADLDGANRRSIPVPRGTANYDVAWSPDGQAIAFTRRASTLIASIRGAVRRVDRRGSFRGPPSWSRDGGTLAYDWWNGRKACDRHARIDAGIAVADLAGGGVRLLGAVQPPRLNPKRARSFTVAGWHPTRPRVLYYMEEWTPGDCGPYIGGTRLLSTTLAHVGINGGKPTIVARARYGIGSAAISPSGREIAYFAGDNDCFLFLVGLDGGNRRRLPVEVEPPWGCYAANGGGLAWAPNGDTLYATDIDEDEVLAINVRTGTARIILGDFGLDCEGGCPAEIMAVSSSGTVAVWADGGPNPSVLWLVSGDGTSRTPFPNRPRASVFLP